MPNVLSPRDLVTRPDNMNETVLSSPQVYIAQSSVSQILQNELTNNRLSYRCRVSQPAQG